MARTIEQATSGLTSACLPCDLAADRQSFAEDVGEYAPSEVTWSGVIVLEEAMTGDGRMIAENALRWATLPIPLRWVEKDSGGHDNAVVVGRILTIERQSGGKIWATGDFDMGSESGREAARLVGENIKNGISVDLDEVSFEIRIAKDVLEDMPVSADEAEEEKDEDLQGPEDENGRVTVADIDADDEVMLTDDARIRAATLVDIPAFEQARITLDEQPTELAASVVGETDLPIADRDQDWDGQAALDRVFEFYTDGEDVDTEGVAKAFLWRDDDADPTLKGSYSLGFADIIDDQLVIVPSGVAATAGGRGVDATDISSEDKDRVKSKICSLYDQIQDEYDDWPDCPFGDEDAAVDNVVAGAFPNDPPAAWFNDPGLAGPTRLTVTDDGRVYGHLATWGTCHTGYHGQCITPPSSSSGYGYFRTGSVVTAEGSEIPTGTLTLDTLHAGKSLSAADTLAHYENTGRGVADVSSGEDEHGIWVSGALRPGVTDEQVRVLRASPLSGDWRRIGGSLELVAALAVNVPGFPIPRPQGLVASGVMTSLVASGILPPDQVILSGPGSLSISDLKYLKRLAERERREDEADKAGILDNAAVLARKLRAQELAREVNGGN